MTLVDLALSEQAAVQHWDNLQTYTAQESVSDYIIALTVLVDLAMYKPADEKACILNTFPIQNRVAQTQRCLM